MGRGLRGAGRGRTLLALIAAEAVAAAVLALALIAPGEDGSEAANRALVSALDLTDLALWPGASYTRHPSQADLFAPFSDHPGAFEHSPAGSVIPAPRRRETEPRPPEAVRPP